MPSMIFHEAVETAVLDSPDGAARLRNDIESILGGKAPTPADLVHAPLLDQWMPLINGPKIALAGKVAGHPLRKNGLIVTSRLCAIDATAFFWARTSSRWYRLGRHFSGQEIHGRPH